MAVLGIFRTCQFPRRARSISFSLGTWYLAETLGVYDNAGHGGAWELFWGECLRLAGWVLPETAYLLPSMSASTIEALLKGNRWITVRAQENSSKSSYHE